MDEGRIAGIIISLVVGLILILSGVLFRKFPPKEINALYGYRTFRSMKSQELWNEGNRYSAFLATRLGITYLVIGGILSFLLPEHILPITLIGLIIAIVVVMVVCVEKRLKQLEGNSR
ncbi:putative membrane protein [Paenibacillus mucilaginosus]|uniref:SdpI family protein n=1 Tax=Paenibacillus mucilaginosus TaxID=61624 RepID=UPI003D1993E9